MKKTPAKEKKPCEFAACGALFTPVKSWQRFCCPEHRDAAHYEEVKAALAIARQNGASAPQQ